MAILIFAADVDQLLLNAVFLKYLLFAMFQPVEAPLSSSVAEVPCTE